MGKNSVHVSNTNLLNSYSQDELYDLINSFDSIPYKTRTLIYGELLLFIGLQDKKEEKLIRSNLDGIHEGIFDSMFH